jgi:hypothetical protein
MKVFSTLYFRRGRDARTLRSMKFEGLDTMVIAEHVAEAIVRYKVEKTFIDGVGVS